MDPKYFKISVKNVLRHSFGVKRRWLGQYQTQDSETKVKKLLIIPTG